MRSLIIDDILSEGGNVSTQYYPGSFRAIGSKFKVSGVTSFKGMEDLLSNGSGKSPSPCCSLGQTENAGKTRTRFGPAADKMQTFQNLTYKGIENIEAQSMATASNSTIGRAVRARLPEGKMTWKKMMRPAGEKFSPDNQV